MPTDFLPLDTGAAASAFVLVIAAAIGMLALFMLAQIPAVVLMWWLREKPAYSRSDAPDDGGSASSRAAADAVPMRLPHAGGQLLGRRELQEDELGFIDGPTLDPGSQHPVVIVADGMGGHASGELASRLAVRAFIEAYGTEGRPADQLRAALDRANQAIDDAIRDNLSLDGMGTTLVAAAVTADGLEWISVGDSPLYLCRGGRLKRLNEDHSMGVGAGRCRAGARPGPGGAGERYPGRAGCGACGSRGPPRRGRGERSGPGRPGAAGRRRRGAGARRPGAGGDSQAAVGAGATAVLPGARRRITGPARGDPGRVALGEAPPHTVGGSRGGAPGR